MSSLLGATRGSRPHNKAAVPIEHGARKSNCSRLCEMHAYIYVNFSSCQKRKALYLANCVCLAAVEMPVK